MVAGHRPEPIRSTSASKLALDSAPSPTTWRRQRLLRLGHSNQRLSLGNSDDEEALNEEANILSQSTGPSYGTLSRTRQSTFGGTTKSAFQRTSIFQREGNLELPTSPSQFFRDRALSRLATERPISAYDAPLPSSDNSGAGADAKVNGIRVWYSSFTSIDWLHDAIKDSVRFSRIRKRKTLRATIRLVIDKSLGWIVVSIVGFLSAIVAFVVVRSEQWLFDMKDGYCKNAWWKTKQYCCPQDGAGELRAFLRVSVDECPNWKSWENMFGEENNVGLGYGMYTLIAVGFCAF
jgi:chloride channel 3/4/5